MGSIPVYLYPLPVTSNNSGLVVDQCKSDVAGVVYQVTVCKAGPLFECQMEAEIMISI